MTHSNPDVISQSRSLNHPALTYWTLDAILNEYLKAPGPLVQA